ncbi:hypothetical protein SAMN04489708_11061 [Paracidovorax cattleyae]|uniref:Uncharacterized protein n=1 Tax=Paracidovorax cattleyae TaxID=80868 RepID=A0A1H0RH80_9BURK|nr:hypothetical protein SAMN04489708_11061 [Paracidovorax cattleyae]
MHTTEELILAAHVRELASAIRTGARAQALKEWERNSMEPNDAEGRAKRDAFSQEWSASHPVASFAAVAYAQIETVADAIKGIRQ